ELVEITLHPYQRGQVGFIIDAARHVKKVAESLANHFIRAAAHPSEQRLVHKFDATIRLQRNVAARRILDHVLVIVDAGVAHGTLRQTRAWRKLPRRARSGWGNDRSPPASLFR